MSSIFGKLKSGANNFLMSSRNLIKQSPSFLAKGLSGLNQARNEIKRIQDVKSRVDEVGRKLSNEVPESVQKSVRGLSGKVDDGLNRANSEIDRVSRVGNVLSGLF